MIALLSAQRNQSYYHVARFKKRKSNRNTPGAFGKPRWMRAKKGEE